MSVHGIELDCTINILRNKLRLIIILTLQIIYSPICSSYLFSMCFPLWFVPGRIFMFFCGISVTGLTTVVPTHI
jgi:hypothetical protein